MDTRKDMLIKEKLCKEKDLIAEKLQNGQEMTIQDLEKLDKIYHTLKNLCKYMEYEEDLGYDEQRGFSGARGRGSDGRYMSRDMGPEWRDEGRMSGHYPYPPYWR